MKNAFKYPFILLILVSLSACNKYPNGGGFSIRSADSRVINTWKYSQVTQNGVDKSGLFATYTIEYLKGGTYKLTAANTLVGTWSLNSDKTQIIITYPGQSQPTVYDILKLRNNELWYKENDPTKPIEYHLSPK